MVFVKLKRALLAKKAWGAVQTIIKSWKENPMPETAEMTTVPVKSAWRSKINGVAVASFLAAVISLFGLPISEQTQKDILAGLTLAVPPIIVIFRTFFNRTVTPK